MPENDPRPFSELRDSGLLWLLNREVFHPRGYALALYFDGDPEAGAPATGWSLLGDGTEPWTYGPEVDESDVFACVKELLA